MSISQAIIATDLPSRYILRLSKHWGHKFVVEFDNERSHIDLGGSVCELLACETGLQVVIRAPNVEFDEMEAVVAEHLQRFAPQGTVLSFNWIRSEAQGNSAQ
jgi:hypothetical protein